MKSCNIRNRLWFYRMPVLERRPMESLDMENLINDWCIWFGDNSHVNNWVHFSISIGFHSLIDGCFEPGLRIRCTNGKSELSPIRIWLRWATVGGDEIMSNPTQVFDEFLFGRNGFNVRRTWRDTPYNLLLDPNIYKKGGNDVPT